jgi:hypothetical protein
MLVPFFFFVEILNGWIGLESDRKVAKMGFPVMAISACFGG